MSSNTDLTKKRTQALEALATTAPLTPAHLIELLAAASKSEREAAEDEIAKARADAQEWQQSAESYEMLYVKTLDELKTLQRELGRDKV